MSDAVAAESGGAESVAVVAAASEQRLGEVMTRLAGEPILTGQFVRTCPAGH